MLQTLGKHKRKRRVSLMKVYVLAATEQSVGFPVM